MALAIVVVRLVKLKSCSLSLRNFRFSTFNIVLLPLFSLSSFAKGILWRVGEGRGANFLPWWEIKGFNKIRLDLSLRDREVHNFCRST